MTLYGLPKPTSTNLDSNPQSQQLQPSSRHQMHFLPPLVFPPSSSHRSTIIFLHGRGSDAARFASPLLSFPVFGHHSLRDALPHTRFVFPTAPLMRATKYRRSVIHQWYDGTGDWEPEARGDMRQSVEHVHDLLGQEMEILGSGGKVVLGGISQGCAMALMSMLLWDGPSLGGVVGICGFMPLTGHLKEILGGATGGNDDDDIVVFGTDCEEGGSTGEGDGRDETGTLPRSPLQQAIAELREEAELATRPATPSPSSPLTFLSTPVFVGHGTEDESVELRHGEQAAALLSLMGLDVEFHAYNGLGHWYSTEMLEQIVRFLSDKSGLDAAF